MADNTQTHRSHWPLSILGGGVSLLNLFLPLVIVRILSPDEVGQYKIFFLYLAMVPLFFFTAGIMNGLSHWAGHASRRVQAFKSSWTILNAIAIGIPLLGWFFESYLSRALGWDLRQTRLLLLASVVFMQANFFDEATVAAGEIWRGAIFTSVFELARGATILVSAFMFRTVNAVFVTYIVVMAVKVLIGAAWGYAKGFQRPTWDPAVAKEIIRYALPVSLSAMLFVISGYADQLVLSQTLSAAEFASYSLGCLLVPPLIIFEQSVNRVLIPKMSHDFSVGLSDRARKLYRDAVSELSWLLIPAAVGTIVFATPIVDLLFTNRYESAAHYLRIYAFYHLANLIPYDVVARARGNGKWIFNQIAIFAVLTFITIYPSVKYFGATGALVDVTTIALLMRLTSLFWIRHRERWTMAKMLPWKDWRRYSLSAACACVTAFLLRPITGSGLLWFAVGGGAFSIVYLGSTMGLFLRRRAQASGTPKIIILTQYLGLGGLERMVLNLARGLKQDGNWSPVIVAYDQTDLIFPTLHEEFKRSDIPVVDIKKGSGISIKVVFALAREVIRNKALVIHSHDLGALIYAVLTKWATLGAVRVIHTQHSFIHLEADPKYKHYEKFFSVFADEIATVSDGATRALS